LDSPHRGGKSFVSAIGPLQRRHQSDVSAHHHRKASPSLEFEPSIVEPGPKEALSKDSAIKAHPTAVPSLRFAGMVALGLLMLLTVLWVVQRRVTRGAPA
jgi:hypothetical protein